MNKFGAVPTIQVDNDSFRVTLWSFAPGAATGWHRHEHDYVVVPMSTGCLSIRTTHDETLVELMIGQSYARPAGVEHDVSNANDFEFQFVEVEKKA